MSSVQPDHQLLANANLLSRLNRLPVTKSIVRLVALLILAWLVEAFDVGIVSSLVLILKDVLNLGPSQVGLLAISAALGIVIGLIPAGRLADRFGRKRVLVFGLAWFTLFTLITPLFQNFWWIVGMRFVAGLGQGAVFPMPYLMMSEYIRSNRRAVAIGWQNGALLAAYILPLLVGSWAVSTFEPEVAWRIPFIIGGLPLLFAFILWKAIPESPRWLLTKGRSDEVRRLIERFEDEAGIEHDDRFVDEHELRALEQTGKYEATHNRVFLALLRRPYALRSFASWSAFASANIVFYVILVYFPTIFQEKGLGSGSALAIVGIMNAISGLGSIAEGYLAERYGRKPLIFSFALLSAVGLVLVGYTSSTAGLLVAAFMAAFFGLSANSITKIYIAEQYPTFLRGVGTASGETFARVSGSVLAVFYVPLILESAGIQAVLWFTAIAAIGLTIPMVLFGRETKGLTLEETGAPLGRAEAVAAER